MLRVPNAKVHFENFEVEIVGTLLVRHLLDQVVSEHIDDLNLFGQFQLLVLAEISVQQRIVVDEDFS